MDDHKCSAGDRFDSLEEKLDRVDQKLDDKFDTYNDLLREHISRTATLEARQEQYDKNQVETKEVIKDLKIVTDEVKMMKIAFVALKKPFWFILSFIVFLFFKGDETFLSFVVFIKGFFGF